MAGKAVLWNGSLRGSSSNVVRLSCLQERAFPLVIVVLLIASKDFEMRAGHLHYRGHAIQYELLGDGRW
jgi:hypothetical protein